LYDLCDGYDYLVSFNQGNQENQKNQGSDGLGELEFRQFLNNVVIDNLFVAIE
jgi:hypothetical protein